MSPFTGVRITILKVHEGGTTNAAFFLSHASIKINAVGNKRQCRYTKTPAMAEYYKIGKLAAVFGLKGEMIFQHTLGKKTSLKGLQAIFTEEKKHSFLPWFIETARIKSEDELYIKFEGVDTREAAMKLTQKEIWVPEAEFKKYASKASPISLLGYMVIDQSNPLSEILEVIEQPHQLLCRIEINSKEVLIPLNEQTIQKIDHRKKQVSVTLPDGLLEIYL